MTKVETTLRSAYLAGPMRGYQDHNFPAFRDATKWLRSQRWEIFSPAERDENDLSIPGVALSDPNHVWEGEHGLAYFMQYDLAAVCSHDAVICLLGWEHSQGARLETMVATEVGHPVFQLPEDGSGELTLIEPDYVREIFAMETLGQRELIEAAPEVDALCEPINTPGESRFALYHCFVQQEQICLRYICFDTACARF